MTLKRCKREVEISHTVSWWYNTVSTVYRKPKRWERTMTWRGPQSSACKVWIQIVCMLSIWLLKLQANTCFGCCWVSFCWPSAIDFCWVLVIICTCQLVAVWTCLRSTLSLQPGEAVMIASVVSSQYSVVSFSTSDKRSVYIRHVRCSVYTMTLLNQ